MLKEKSLIEADSRVARWKIGVWSRWSQFKISCYEVTTFTDNDFTKEQSDDI